MIQDIAPWRLHNEFMSATPSLHDGVLDINEQGLLMPSESLCLPDTETWLHVTGGDLGNLIYAFRLTRPGAAARNGPLPESDTAEGASSRLFLVLRAPGSISSDPEGWIRRPVRELRGHPAPLPLVAATAHHLHAWYDVSRFCGRCGTSLTPSPAERAMICPSCGHITYPSIAPCVIVAVTSGNRLLLTRYARPGATRLVLVAGFVEIGETAEQAAAREVMEETGLHIKKLRFTGTQPWGLSGTLATGYTAELDGPDNIRLDTSELVEALWVDRADIPPCPDDSSLTMTMISRFARGEL